MLKLKNYQSRTLTKLTEFLEKSWIFSPQQVFEEVQDAPGFFPKYHSLPELENIPYVCLRLPTGGGKTLLSSYIIGVVANAYMEIDFPIVLWLTPTDIIRRQTLETLKNPQHPNREALDSQFGGLVRIFDISEFPQLRQQDIGGAVCIFVATFAAFRVNSTGGRKVYAHHEELEPHFKCIPSRSPHLELNDQGEIKYSFANLLAYHNPLVIVDEAHNHTSKLSIEVLQRIRPAAIVELTATPANNSNVLFKVSASELKAEDMIKLPVRLIEHKSWEDAVTNAIQTRERLDELAKNEEQYIRPIVLFQAENKDKDVTVDVILKYLTEDENIPREAIAVATGEQRELDGIDLFDPDCTVKYVITIQALKEGWDCSFAYVFCSTARVQSAKDAEQLLGRVLRMPYAKRRKQDDLNRAYAHVSVTTWSEAVSQIRDNMISMGFEDVEAENNIQYEQIKLLEPEEKPAVFCEEVVVYSSFAPEITSLNFALQADTDIEKTDNGYKVTFLCTSQNDLRELESKASIMFTSSVDQQQLVKEVTTKQGYTRPPSPAEKGEKLIVPQLCLNFGDGEFGVAERESFLPDGWNILDFPTNLDNFQPVEDGHAFEIDIKGTKIYERVLEGQEALSLGIATHWTEAQLVGWLDRKLRQPDIPYTSLVEFIRRHVRYLQEFKKVNLPDLVRLRFVLEKLLKQKISNCREKSYEQGVQNVLFDTPEVAYVSSDVSVVFQEGQYPVNSFYRGSFRFLKHFFPVISTMNNEEIECAKALEMNKKVKTWVRNLERQPQSSFWLPTSTDKFYPDFVAQLFDGRILVVEYKGEQLATNKDTQEKDMIGQLWAKQSGGNCLFLMATKNDTDGKDLYTQINKIIEVN
ncbi:type III restriction enzyme, res subunit [Desulforamulus reducens MI-1]|uniref:Type III restriction enzyme, res subunit n=1 Tax=Desulforamulus reducens (strain ATCC BAA-1160 / DSM 100696 / MI-1) TaxID=349161 RepID=A4J2V2_DESRM|nr:DEAD/DEAH box helicase family protein [Desulforamulus reducens]ABO49405.1 type III restriction enzyme, res subunit [Desulforamulus reducens MI-1]